MLLDGYLMKKVKATLDFIQFQPLVKVGFCRNVSGHLASNVVFLNPTIPLEEVNAAIDAFEAAILDAQDGSHTAKAIMREKELLIDTMFTTLCAFVNTVANGDVVIITSSGFNMSKQPEHRTKSILAIHYTEHSGVVEVESATGDKVVAFSWEICIEVSSMAEKVWVPLKTTTQCKCIIDGLIPGQYISVRVSLLSPAGTSDFSDPVTKLII